MKWEIETINHIGGRHEQQDRVANFSSSDGKRHLLVVADGMGGYDGGSLASQIVVESAQSVWNDYQKSSLPYTPKSLLQYICEVANDKIIEAGTKYNISPRSTCVLLYIKDNKVWWAYVGDSRLYHFRGKQLLWRTRDHSVVQLLADLGDIKEEEMADHPDQGRLLKGLGSKKGSIQPDFGKATVCSGDSLVLCSDGFWEYVVPKKMSEKLPKNNLPLKQKVYALLNETLEAGAIKGDNITIAVAQLSCKLSCKNNANTLWKSLILFIVSVSLTSGLWYFIIIKPLLISPLLVNSFSSNNTYYISTALMQVGNSEN
ncbi:MAG: serine/threonine-protein phosphatase [Thiomargarita sp.]|nr:serine/threonine-protein phosphatase [Thiomargarita sp.]